MVRPIIGITGELDAARWGDWIREAVLSPVSYIRAVDRSGTERPRPLPVCWRRTASARASGGCLTCCQPASPLRGKREAVQ